MENIEPLQKKVSNTFKLQKVYFRYKLHVTRCNYRVVIFYPCIEGLFSVHPEVADAVASGEPVVALETTIVTHGMPHPQNIDTALEVEAVVRSAGAVPASIGVLDGTVHVGMQIRRVEGKLNYHK